MAVRVRFRRLLAVTLAFVVASAGHAIALTGLTTANPAFISDILCTEHPGYVCRVSALEVTPLAYGPNETFQQAWSYAQPDNYWDPASWTLNWSNQPLNATFNITAYRAFEFSDAAHHYGGAEIRFSWSPAPEQADLRWIQAVYDPAFHTSQPYYLDVLRNVAPWNQAPLYPFQYPNYFYDAPYRWCLTDRQVTWDAYLYLARVDRTNKIATIYEGVHWGYTIDCVPVPEPASIASALIGCAALALRRRTGA